MKIIILEIDKRTKEIKREIPFLLRKDEKESLTDFFNYVKDDFIPNEILKSQTSIIPFPRFEYKLKEI